MPNTFEVYNKVLMYVYSVTRPDDFFSKKAISSKANAWQTMTAIKSNILKRIDSAPTSVRVCAIKFVQKVVQVQSPGVIADPRVYAHFRIRIEST